MCSAHRLIEYRLHRLALGDCNQFVREHVVVHSHAAHRAYHHQSKELHVHHISVNTASHSTHASLYVVVLYTNTFTVRYDVAADALVSNGFMAER